MAALASASDLNVTNPKLPHMRVSFTYELAARGFVFVVQPDVFVIHHRTPALGLAQTYGHQPEEWMIGETCWPDFENRIRLKYNFREVRGGLAARTPRP